MTGLYCLAFQCLAGLINNVRPWSGATFYPRQISGLKMKIKFDNFCPESWSDNRTGIKDASSLIPPDNRTGEFTRPP